MPPALWSLEQRATLYLLKTRFELTNEEVRLIMYRIYGNVFEQEGRSYSAQNFEDEFAQRWKPSKSKMWFDIDKKTYTTDEQAHLDRLLQDIQSAAAQGTVSSPPIALVQKVIPYVHSGSTDAPPRLRVPTGRPVLGTSTSTSTSATLTAHPSVSFLTSMSTLGSGSRTAATTSQLPASMPGSGAGVKSLKRKVSAGQIDEPLLESSPQTSFGGHQFSNTTLQPPTTSDLPTRTPSSRLTYVHKDEGNPAEADARWKNDGHYDTDLPVPNAGARVINRNHVTTAVPRHLASLGGIDIGANDGTDSATSDPLAGFNSAARAASATFSDKSMAKTNKANTKDQALSTTSHVRCRECARRHRKCTHMQPEAPTTGESAPERNTSSGHDEGPPQEKNTSSGMNSAKRSKPRRKQDVQEQEMIPGLADTIRQVENHYFAQRPGLEAQVRQTYEWERAMGPGFVGETAEKILNLRVNTIESLAKQDQLERERAGTVKGRLVGGVRDVVDDDGSEVDSGTVSRRRSGKEARKGSSDGKQGMTDKK